MATLLTAYNGRGYGLVNPAACTDKELKQYLQAIDLIAAMGDKDLLSLQNPQVGYNFTMTFENISMSWENDDFIQQEIKPGNVLNLLLDPDAGLLTGHTLVRHIVMMFPPTALDENKNPVEVDTGILCDGRNRFAVLVFIKIIQLLMKQQIDIKKLVQTDVDALQKVSLAVMYSEEFRNSRTYVHAAWYDSKFVELANSVRKMPVDEKIFIQLQNMGIDITEHSILQGILTKKCSLSIGFQGLFTLMNIKKNLNITNVCACAIGRKVAGFLKGNKYVFPSKEEDFSTLLDLAWTRVGVEINVLLDQGMTEIARFGVAPIATNVGNYITSQGYKAWMSPEQLATLKAAPKKGSSKKGSPKNTSPKNGKVTVTYSEPKQEE